MLLIVCLCPAADRWSAAQTAGADPNLHQRLKSLAGVVEVNQTRFDKQLFAYVAPLNVAPAGILGDGRPLCNREIGGCPQLLPTGLGAWAYCEACGSP